MSPASGESVQVEVEHLRHLHDFLDRMVARGVHVHAKCWALVAAIPDEPDPAADRVRQLVEAADFSAGNCVHLDKRPWECARCTARITLREMDTSCGQYPSGGES